MFLVAFTPSLILLSMFEFESFVQILTTLSSSVQFGTVIFITAGLLLHCWGTEIANERILRLATGILLQVNKSRIRHRAVFATPCRILYFDDL